MMKLQFLLVEIALVSVWVSPKLLDDSAGIGPCGCWSNWLYPNCVWLANNNLIKPQKMISGA